MKKYFFLSLILLFSIRLTSYSQEYRATLGGKQTTFSVSNDNILVRFTSTSTEDARTKAIAKYQQLKPYKSQSSTPTPLGPNFYRIEFNEPVDPGDVHHLAKTLAADSVNFLFAHPMLVHTDGTLQGYSERFHVRLKEQTSKKSLDSLCQLTGVTILKQNTYNEDIYHLAAGKSSNYDGLTTANQFYATGLFEFSEPDFVKFLKKLTNDTYFNYQWGIKNTGSSLQYNGTPGADLKIESAWQFTNGSPNIKVAIVDEGVDLVHPDLSANLLPGYDATGQNSGGAPSANDAHGTNCAGIVVAVSNNNLGVSGVAPGCKVVPVRIAYEAGLGWMTSDAWISDGLNWAWKNGQADILSNSWGGGSTSSLINTAITNAISQGRNGLGSIVFFAAGNYNGPLIYPATLTQVIAVGASSMCDERKSYTSCDGESFWGSNYGTGVDVFAPGVKIYSTDISGARGYSTGDYYATFNGTSSATPAASAVMALILSANPTLNIQSARYALESNCDKVGGYAYLPSVNGQPNGTWSNDMGYGRINAYNAVKSIAFLPCAGLKTLNTPTGLLGDGSGSRNYAPNSNCEWIISPTGGASTINLSFLDFSIEPTNDFVEIFDGNNATGTLLGRFSGNALPSSVYAYSGSMFVRFISNDSINAAGWTATYTSCASVLSAPIVTSSGSNTFCQGNGVTLTAPNGYTNYQWFQNGVSIPNAISQSFIANESGIYSVSTKSTNGCSTRSVNTTIHVIPQPLATITSQGNPATLCNNISLPLSAATCNGCNYQWLFNDAPISGAISSSLTATNTGFYSVEVTDPATSCSNSSALVEVSAANITATTTKSTVCNGDTATLNVLLNSVPFGNNAVNYSFLWSPSGALNTSTVVNPIAHPSVNTTYLVTVKESATGCSKSTAVAVSLANAPSSVITANGPTIFCDSGSVNLSVPSGAALSYQWYLNGSSIAGATSSILTANHFGNYTAEVINAHTNCFSYTANPLQIINSQPDVTIFSSSNPSSFCQNIQTILSVASGAGYTYQWYKYGAIISTGTSFQLPVNGSADYSVKITNSSNCSNTSPLFTIGFGSIQTTATPNSICVGDTSILSVSIIEGSKSTVFFDNFDPIQNANWAINTGTVATFCGAVTGKALYFNDPYLREAETIPLNVSKGGTVSFYLVIGSGYAPCENADPGEGVYLQYSTDGGNNWNQINYYDVGIYNTPTLINEILPPGAQTNTTQFRWVQQAFSGLGFDNWALDNISISTPIANGQYNYSWSPSIGTTANLAVTPSKNTKYYVVVTDPNSGCSKRDSISVQVIEPSLATIFIDGSANVCANDSVLLYTNVITLAGLSIQWNKDGQVLYGQNQPYLYAKLPGVYSVSISNSASNCAISSPNTITLTSIPSPNAQIQSTGSTTSFCNTFNVKMSAISIPAHLYQWSLNGSPIPNATSSNYTATQAGSYSVAIKNTLNGCISTSAPEILSTASVTVFSTSNLVCSYYDSTRLSALVTGYFIPGEISETFDPINASNWAINDGIISTACGSYLGNALLFTGTERILQTNPMNSSYGGTISFYLKIAYYYSTNTTCEPADYSDVVTLEYSTNGGAYWNVINTYYPYNYSNFTQINEQIPLSARGSNVIFRWRQASFSGSGMDVWGLDNINIITGGVSNGYSFAWTPTTGVYNPSSPTTSVRPSATTAYTVKVTENATGCSIYGTTVVTNLYNTSPQIQTNKTPNICQGDTVILSVPYIKNFNYSWTNNGGYIYTNSTAPNIAFATTQGSYQVELYSYSANGSYCNIYSNYLTVNVNPLPNATITSSGPISTLCPSINVTLNVPYVSGDTYQWNKNGIAIPQATNSSYTAISAGAYTVSVTNTAFNNCSNISSPVNVQAGTITIDASKTTFCNSDTIQLNAFVPGQGQAMFQDNFDPYINNSLWYSLQGCYADISCGAVSGNALYFYGSYRVAQTNYVNVSNGGNISFYIKLAGTSSTAPCDAVEVGDDVYLQYSTNYGSTWTTIQKFSAGSYSSFTDISVPIPTYAQTSYTMFRWTQPTFSGYGYDNWAIDNVQIGTTATSGNGYTYTWFPSTYLNSSNISNPIAIPSGTITYTATIQEASSGCSGTGSITLNKTNGPSNTLVVTGSTALCPNGSVTLSADVNSSATTYQWYNGSSPIFGANNYSLIVTSAGNYSCNFVSDCGNVTSNSVKVTQNPSPPIPYITPFGDSLYSSNLTGNQWFLNNLPIVSATGTKLRPIQSGNYQLQITNAFGCSAISAPYAFTSSVLSLSKNPTEVSVSIFPNPANDFLTIQVSESEDPYQVAITNLLGTSIFQTSYPSVRTITIDTRTLSSGLYLLNLSIGNRHQLYKVEIQR